MKKISFSSWISMTSSFKKTKVQLDLLTDIDVRKMKEKDITGGTCHFINQYAKAINKYMKDYDKNKESPYLQY